MLSVNYMILKGDANLTSWTNPAGWLCRVRLRTRCEVPDVPFR
jgi:hypothetical protein